MSQTHKAIVIAGLMSVGLTLILISQRETYVEHHEHYEVGGELVAEAPRSSAWPKVRQAYLSKHPRCEACGTKADLNVHHVVPFHENPDLELDMSNLITLCRKHHLEIGHRCDSGKVNWATCSNPNVRRDAAKERRRNVP